MNSNRITDFNIACIPCGDPAFRGTVTVGALFAVAKSFASVLSRAADMDAALVLDFTFLGLADCVADSAAKATQKGPRRNTRVMLRGCGCRGRRTCRGRIGAKGGRNV